MLIEIFAAEFTVLELGDVTHRCIFFVAAVLARVSAAACDYAASAPPAAPQTRGRTGAAASMMGADSVGVVAIGLHFGVN